MSKDNVYILDMIREIECERINLFNKETFITKLRRLLKNFKKQ